LAATFKDLLLNESRLFSTLFLILTVFGCRAPEIPSVFSTVYSPAPDYLLCSGDRLELGLYGPCIEKITGRKDFKTEVRIRIDGVVSFPFLDDQFVAGRTLEDVRSGMAKMMAKSLKTAPGDFRATMELLHTDSKSIHIFGEVNKPGRYPFNGSIRILDSVSLANGFNTKRASREVVLVRSLDDPNKIGFVTDVDMNEMLEDGDQSHNFFLESGDIIIAKRSLSAIISDTLAAVFSPVSGVIEGLVQVLLPTALSAGSSTVTSAAAGGIAGNE